MMNTIPIESKLRVSNWFSCGGPKGDWDYQEFIRHFNENFEDKTSARAASITLKNMKQGDNQSFSEYLRDFEYILAQAKGLNWEGRMKVDSLYMGLNDQMTKALYSIDTSDDNYPLFVSQLRAVAGKMEAHSGLIRFSDNNLKTNYNINPKTYSNYKSTGESSETNTAKVDGAGDTVMSGINGLSMKKLVAIINAVNTCEKGEIKEKHNKPPAPWRSQAEFDTLRAEGKCTRCAEQGHWFKRCPRFTWAKKPPNVKIKSSEVVLDNWQNCRVNMDEESGKE